MRRVHRDGSGPMSPGILFAAVTLVLVVLLAVLALSVRQAPPPTIAEFAPQAVERITDADQTANAGTGRRAGDGEHAGSNASQATPTPAAIDVPRVRRCVGDPPRQIEDPQSPPCVPYWSGDNGGATTKGVTRDEIRIAVAGAIDSRLESFFNTRFEFYGRKLRLASFTPKGAARADVSTMQSDAVEVDSMNVFAEFGYTEDQFGGAAPFYDELARRGIVSSQSTYTGSPASSEAEYDERAPFEWNYMPSADKVVTGFGSWICNSLARRPPVYSGIVPLPPERVFGILTSTNPTGAPALNVEPLVQAGKACGVKFVVVQTDSQDGTTGQAIATKFQAEHVTTIVSFVNGQLLDSFLMPPATGQGYFPEWMISDFYHAQDDLMGRQAPPEHAAHLFGLRSWNKSLPHEQTPNYWAYKEVDPSYTAVLATYNFTYWNLLVLASGIQLAGPHLTPQAFQDGLFKASFPNPACGAAPYYQGCVDFGPGNHTMIQDLAQIWFAPNEPSYDTESSVGAYCYVAGGTRFRPNAFPRAEPELFRRPCR